MTVQRWMFAPACGAWKTRGKLFLGFSAWLLLSVSTAWAQQFQIAPQYPVVLGPMAYDGVGVARADFNRDGKMDLVVSPGTGLYLSVALGNGDGTFQTPVQYLTGGFGFQDTVVVADFNNDGNPDIAEITDGVVSVLLGNGDGTFQPHRDYPAPPSAAYAAVADFNGDGFPDLVVAAGYTFAQPNGQVTVLINNGDGSFAQGVNYPAATAGVVAVGDLNGDGKMDIVVGSQGYDGQPNNVDVLLGKGDGTFAPVVSYPLNSGSGGIVIADLNGDGKLDVASWTPFSVSGFSGQVGVLLGNGDGTLQKEVDYSVGNGYVIFSGTGIVAGDFNGDGKSDLAVTNQLDNTVSVLFGDGDGTFEIRQDYGVGSGAVGLVAGDFNGDHRDDLVVVDSYASSLSVLLSSSSGTLLSNEFYATGNAPSGVAVGDFNGDGKSDIAVANGNPFAQKVVLGDYIPSQTVSVFLGNGDGTFQSHHDYPTGNYPLSVAAADFNGDGRQDLVTANRGDNTVSVLLANADGTFRPRVDYPTASAPWSVVVGDFNGDGKRDLAVAASGGDVVSILLGNGDGTFQSHVEYATGSVPVFLAVGDFNGDGKLDLVSANLGDTVSVLLGRGDGTFMPHVDFGAGGPPLSVAVGDFNHDGKSDLVVTNGGQVCNSLGCSAGTTIGVLLGNGDGTFQPVVQYPAGAGPQWVALGDFNGDGKPDLAVANSNIFLPNPDDNLVFEGATVSVFWGNGDGTFGPRVDYLTAAGTYAAAVGDFNDDHRDDLAVVDSNSNGVEVFLNTANNPHLLVVTLSSGQSVPGSVASSFGGINCRSSCTAAYNSGAMVTLTPTPASGLGFTGWSGDCSGTGSCLLDMTTDRSVTASFVAVNFTLSVDKAGSGTGTVYDVSNPPGIDCGVLCSASYAAGLVVGLAAVPDAGMTFSGWSGGGCSGTSNCAIPLDSDTTLVATFTLPAGDSVLTVNSSGGGGGTVTSTPPGITNCSGPSCSGTQNIAAFATGTVITLTATPDSYSYFAGWNGGGCSGSTGVCTLTLNSSQTVTATFGPSFTLLTSPQTPVTVSPGQSATFTVAVSETYNLNGSVSLACSVQPNPALAPQCLLNPTSITSLTIAMLTITTTPSSTAKAPPVGPASRFYAWLGLVALAFCYVRLQQQPKTRSKSRGVLVVFLLFSGLLLQPACGGGGSNTGVSTNNGTPPGNYTITVTGTSSAAPSSSATLTLTVQ
jgi:hypothetical protein